MPKGQPVVPPNRIRELREARGWKLYDISAQVRVDPATVSRWELGLSTVPDPTKFALAAMFEVSVVHMMGWEGA